MARRPILEGTDQYFFNDLLSASKNNTINPFVLIDIEILKFFLVPFSLIAIISATSLSGISLNSFNISFYILSSNRISFVFSL